MKPYHKNPRQITGKQYEQLTGTLAELGDLSGIVHDLNSDEIIGGNQRSRVFDVNKCDVVLTEQYDEPDAQGTVAHGYVIWNGAKYAYRQVRWTAKQCEKANIVANKAGGSWDFDTLSNEFEVDELLDWGFEAFELGIDELDDTNAGADTEPEIDRAEELRQKWGVETGQLWQLGDHRLICGDCTDEATVARVMESEKSDLVFTSPPYPGADMWETEGEKLTQIGNRCLAILPSVLKENCVVGWNTSDIPLGNNGYVCNSARDTITALNLGFKKRGEIVWEKGLSYLPPMPYYRRPSIPHNTHEFILMFIWGDWKPRDKEGQLTSEQMEWNRETIWKIHTESATEIGHKAPFPLELVNRCVSLWSLEGDTVYDPFCGSGTTIIACENLGRKCRAVEISPAYVAVALERWAQHTGRTPELIDA